MKKIFSLSVLSVFISVLSVFPVLAADGSADRSPAFSITKTDGSEGKGVDVVVAQGSVFSINLAVSNHDKERGINLGFKSVGFTSDVVDSTPVPEDWFVFSPSEYALMPETSGEFELSVVVPGNAEPGVYEALVQAVLNDYDGRPQLSSGVGVNVAVGIPVKIDVSEKNDKVGEIADYKNVGASNSESSSSDAQSGFSGWIYLAVAFLVIIAIFLLMKSKK